MRSKSYGRWRNYYDLSRDSGGGVVGGRGVLVAGVSVFAVVGELMPLPDVYPLDSRDITRLVVLIRRQEKELRKVAALARGERVRNHLDNELLYWRDLLDRLAPFEDRVMAKEDP
jgi:hypothetical protein